MGTPNPGSGGFYLDLAARRPHSARRNEVRSHWGGFADPKADAPIRGRKFYWHSDPEEQAKHWGRAGMPRYRDLDRNLEPGGRQPTEMAQQVQLVPAGTTLTGVVTIDHLDETAIHALLAALDPQRILGGSGPYAVHLGGGKPFGLGSATVSITEIALEEVGDRYTAPDKGPSQDSQRATPDWSAMDAGVRNEVVERVGNIDNNCTYLARVLNPSALGEDHLIVSYPPGASWAEFSTPAFRESFKFFRGANGQQLQGHARPWYPLPHIGDDDQRLPINP